MSETAASVLNVSDAPCASAFVQHAWSLCIKNDVGLCLNSQRLHTKIKTILKMEGLEVSVCLLCRNINLLVIKNTLCQDVQLK